MLVQSNTHTHSWYISWVLFSGVNSHGQKQLGDGRVYFILYLISQSLREARTGWQGKTLEVRTVAEIMEGCYLLACSSWIAQLVFLYIPGSSSCSELDRCTSVINQENVLQPNLMELFSQLRILL